MESKDIKKGVTIVATEHTVLYDLPLWKSVKDQTYNDRTVVVTAFQGPPMEVMRARWIKKNDVKHREVKVIWGVHVGWFIVSPADKQKEE